MRQEKQVMRTWYECDQCGYSLGEKLREDSITLVVGKKQFHFHGTEYPHMHADGVDQIMEIMFDHTKSCIARWFLAGSHIHAIQETADMKPQKLYYRQHNE